MDRRLINSTTAAYERFVLKSNEITKLAQIYVDWGEVRCEYEQSEGLVIVMDIDNKTSQSVPIEEFFSVAEESGCISSDEWKSIAT